jgi:spectinomycin phosphotransferase
MLERPNLADDLIAACLHQAFGIAVTTLEFLPIGNDPTAWVYKVSSTTEIYFLKVKRGFIAPASVNVPYYLHQSDIEQVVTPLPNLSSELWTPLADYNLILYPYIDGQTGMDIGLSNQQWAKFGAILRKIHTTNFPSSLLGKIPHESFILNPKWTATIQSLQEMLVKNDFKDGLKEDIAAFWHEHSEEIVAIVSRTQELGRQLQARSLPFVICHADIHTANVLVDREGHLFVVDWDGTMFAPKERDLMFIVGERSNTSDQEQAFMEGYGTTDIDWQAIAYYRYEWVVQEIAEYAKLVFIASDVGDITKADAVRGFKQLFDSGDVVEQAYDSEKWIT